MKEFDGDFKKLAERVKQRQQKQWSTKEKDVLQLMIENCANLNDVIDLKDKYFKYKTLGQIEYKFYEMKREYVFEQKKKGD